MLLFPLSFVVYRRSFYTTATLIGTTVERTNRQTVRYKRESCFRCRRDGNNTGGCCGNSTVTSYVESATGVEAGGRTGWCRPSPAALPSPSCPLILAIPPSDRSGTDRCRPVANARRPANRHERLYESAPVAPASFRFRHFQPSGEHGRRHFHFLGNTRRDAIPTKRIAAHAVDRRPLRCLLCSPISLLS